MGKFVGNPIQQEVLWTKPQAPPPARPQQASIKYERRCHCDLQPVLPIRIGKQ
jgi:hypothetical protein